MHRLILLLPLLWLGCHHEKAAVVSPKPAAMPIQPASQPASRPVTEAVLIPRCASDGDCSAGRLCLDGTCVPATDAAAGCGLMRVHFDCDRSDVHEADYGALQHLARCLKADPKLHLAIEGNCDERGTEEYNLALGDRRARAVAAYLEALGIAPDRLRTVSFGKTRPLCHEHEEGCWARNRRAALKHSGVQEADAAP